MFRSAQHDKNEEGAGRRSAASLPSTQPALPEIAHVTAAGTLDEVDGELQQAYFPGVVDALDHGAEWFFGMLDLPAGALDNRFHGVADAVFYYVRFAKLEAVTKHGHVARPLAQH